MDSIFLIYKTDVWHSYNSRDLIAIATNKEEVMNLCIDQARKEKADLTQEQLYNLRTINQTQRYDGEGEFFIEQCEVNTLL